MIPFELPVALGKGTSVLICCDVFSFYSLRFAGLLSPALKSSDIVIDPTIDPSATLQFINACQHRRFELTTGTVDGFLRLCQQWNCPTLQSMAARFTKADERQHCEPALPAEGAALARDFCALLARGMRACLDELAIQPGTIKRLRSEFDRLFGDVQTLFLPADPGGPPVRRRELLLEAEELADLCRRIVLGCPAVDEQFKLRLLLFFMIVGVDIDLEPEDPFDEL
jgi:hypothetical protein